MTSCCCCVVADGPAGFLAVEGLPPYGTDEHIAGPVSTRPAIVAAPEAEASATLHTCAHTRRAVSKDFGSSSCAIATVWISSGPKGCAKAMEWLPESLLLKARAAVISSACAQPPMSKSHGHQQAARRPPFCAPVSAVASGIWRS